jgi:hypothetical protein
MDLDQLRSLLWSVAACPHPTVSIIGSVSCTGSNSEHLCWRVCESELQGVEAVSPAFTAILGKENLHRVQPGVEEQSGHCREMIRIREEKIGGLQQPRHGADEWGSWDANMSLDWPTSTPKSRNQDVGHPCTHHFSTVSPSSPLIPSTHDQQMAEAGGGKDDA